MEHVLERSKLPSTVLIIDDDTTLLHRYVKESHRNTNLGLVAASDLASAAKYLESGLPIGAILTDLHFRAQFQDADRNLHNGLDLLKFCKSLDRDLPFYVMSMDADDHHSRKQAQELGVTVRKWYDKLEDVPHHKKPWAAIERDLIVLGLKRDAKFRGEVEFQGLVSDLIEDERLAEKVQSLFNFPRLTYLQSQHLPYGAKVWIREPIEVHCWPQDDGYVARAVRVPLLVDGVGDDPAEALVALAELLVEEWESLSQVEPKMLQGYAKFVKSQLETYLVAGREEYLSAGLRD